MVWDRVKYGKYFLHSMIINFAPFLRNYNKELMLI